MAKRWGVDITGIADTLKNSRCMGTNVKSCVRTAVLQLAGKIQTQAKINVQTLVIPKSAGGTTEGRLAGSVTMAANFLPSAMGLQSPAVASDAVKAPGEDPDKFPMAAVGTNVEYARRIEHGFQGQDSLGRTYNQAPKPYLHPAFFAYENDLQKTLKAVVDKEKALSYFKSTLPYFDSGGIQD